MEWELLLELEVVLELAALVLLAVGLELGVDNALVPDEVDVEAADDEDDADAVGVGVVVVVVLVLAVLVLAVVELAGIDAMSASVPATLTTATPALTAVVLFAPLRAASGVRPAFRAITLLPSLEWCGPRSVVHHPAADL
ncbi:MULTISPECIES: hypothetical protein [Streptacidiphilus]|uniref:Secreted peptide n=1 Tax=Streptacidiphilus cavernicola TaxID=3342716 RepID=A0ABV6UE17_9ACTN|nr:hypothetical protein [Streptacidiphilus jeojiense]